MTNVKSLLEMYVKMGGSLTDTYSDIAGGVPVGQYSTISDAILACSKKYSAGGGGGAEKFVVTLTKENDTWTADKTVAEIVAADAANKVVVAKFPRDGMYVELPLNVAIEYQGVYVTMFIGLVNSGNDNKIVSVQCTNQGSGDVIATTEQPIPTSTNAPLIVTLTVDQSTGNLVGNKTYKEVYDAFSTGRSVFCKGVVGSTNVSASVLAANETSGEYSLNVCVRGSIVVPEGTATDYLTLHLGN